MSAPARDHGGGIDAACARWGGKRADWLDLSTGINPRPYPLQELPASCWTALPDRGAAMALEAAARRFWNVPEGAAALAAPGASALIALLPLLARPGRAAIPAPTYNEHAAAFAAQGWRVDAAADPAPGAEALVLVHPNNPDGRLHEARTAEAPLVVIDESFCDVTPDHSLIAQAARPGRLVLKSFGKFWGLAGLRLGFAFGDPELIARLAALLGPWPVAGPAQEIGRRALEDDAWAARTRARLAADAARLDELLAKAGAACVGGTSLFRLYESETAQALHEKLARQRILTRVFPYEARWLRLGLPDGTGWGRLEAAL